jgi:LPPG:FO 2-phospho-L-lactate transferase
VSAAEVVVLCGGTGGAKLASGVAAAVGPERLAAIVNTGDDIEIYGAYVSPDPDLISFWLADRIDERGWGLRDDTFEVMEGLRALGVEIWFNLGDRDLAIGLERARALRAGERLTDVHARITRSLGVDARVLPMSDDPVRTRVMAGGEVSPLQEYLIKRGSPGPIEDVEFRGAASALPSDEVLGAIESARAIVIGPSNPVISIGPILALAELRAALQACTAPMVAVSPIVAGEVIKGPTELFMRWARRRLGSAGVAAAYKGLIDGLVSDEASGELPELVTDVLMGDAAARRRVAAETLEFALGLERR